MTDMPLLWNADDRPVFLFDWDSTLCQEETLDFLAEYMLEGEELTRFHDATSQGMSGNLSFSESLARRFALLRANRENVLEAARALTELVDPTALESRKFFEENRDRVFIVSGGFEELIMPSLPLLGIDPSQVYANRFLYDGEGMIAGADPSRLTSQDDGKAAQVAALGINGVKVVVGDGYNDYRIKALGHADFYVAYSRHKRRDQVIPLADMVVDSFSQLRLA
jgi:D-3-phosphoglycerate dehydrogenase